MTETDLLYTLALQHVPNIGSINAKKLIAHCGSAAAVFKEKYSNLIRINGIGRFTLSKLNEKSHLTAAEKELKFITNSGVHTHYFLSDTYPYRLKHCPDGPILLFSRGHINLENKRVISVVGARKATTYGINFCESLIEALAVYNPVIISGFAYGIDIAAQKAALEYNLQTIACLAHGLDQIYPKVHTKYVKDVEAHGGLYSDFWSSDKFDKTNFLKRNRIIAGISEATIVVESAKKGGSLVTADIANSYDREVFAVPGKITDSQSEGCNNLIKYQKAHLLSHPLDIPILLNWKFEKAKPQVFEKTLDVELKPEEKKVVDYLKAHVKAHIDGIALYCEIPTNKLAGVLLTMELKGVIRPLPGKHFQLS